LTRIVAGYGLPTVVNAISNGAQDGERGRGGIGARRPCLLVNKGREVRCAKHVLLVRTDTDFNIIFISSTCVSLQL